VKDEDKAKILFEINYCNLYEKIMKSFTCTTVIQNQPEKLKMDNISMRQKALLLQFNQILSEVADDYKVHN
jgi:hypothetical protein